MIGDKIGLLVVPYTGILTFEIWYWILKSVKQQWNIDVNKGTVVMDIGNEHRHTSHFNLIYGKCTCEWFNILTIALVVNFWNHTSCLYLRIHEHIILEAKLKFWADITHTALNSCEADSYKWTQWSTQFSTRNTETNWI